MPGFGGRGGGRGRGGRVRFGGSGNPALSDVLDETREDLGLSYAQMEQLQDEGAALFPPVALPQPDALSSRDVYLIQRQRVLAHKLEGLYHPWQEERGGTTHVGESFVHVTVPENAKPEQVFVPAELRTNTVRDVQMLDSERGRKGGNGVLQPQAFDRLFKNLEAKEQRSDKTKPGEEQDEPIVDEQEDDLGDDMNDYTFDYYGESDAGSEAEAEEEYF